MISYNKRMQEAIADELAKEGRRIIGECEAERGYTHRTRNLRDSYGYGVYAGGKIVRMGFLSAAREATKPRRWYSRGDEFFGRDEIVDFLENKYVPVGGMDLVVATVMPYASILERKGYDVISMSFDKMKAIRRAYNASVYAISKGRRLADG